MGPMEAKGQSCWEKTTPGQTHGGTAGWRKGSAVEEIKGSKGTRNQRHRKSERQGAQAAEAWKSSHKGEKCRETETATEIFGGERYQRSGRRESLGGHLGLRQGQRTMTKNKDIQGNRTEA